ncbi:MAG: chromate transporter [Anaeroplasmataceae bacterium]
MKDLFKLFYVFARMGLVNFGGGYALLPLLQKDIVEKYKWASSEEIEEYYAIGQCTPGIISVNVSTFIGYKVKGVLGALFSTIGFLTPSIIIIILIASLLVNFSDYKIVQDAFAGIRVCVVALILSAIIKLFKKSIIDIPTLLIFILVIVLSLFTPVSSVYFVIIAGICGIMINSFKLRKSKNINDENDSNDCDKSDES